MKKYGGVYTPGTLCAGDGILIPIGILLPSEYIEMDICLDRFMNRKGFWGINCQALVDAWCRFCVFESNWPSTVHDVVCYQQTLFFIKERSKLPAKFHHILDEAYKSIADGKHITPFSGSEISEADEHGKPEAANMMRTFNKIFCSDRITVERTFGQLVMKFLILW